MITEKRPETRNMTDERLLNTSERAAPIDGVGHGKAASRNLRAISRNCGNAYQIKFACFQAALSSNPFLGSRIVQYSCLELLHAFSQLLSGR